MLGESELVGFFKCSFLTLGQINSNHIISYGKNKPDPMNDDINQILLHLFQLISVFLCHLILKNANEITIAERVEPVSNDCLLQNTGNRM